MSDRQLTMDGREEDIAPTYSQDRLFTAPKTMEGQMAMDTDISGRRVLITWKRYECRPDETYTAVAHCVDPMGTLTFKRDEDGFLGYCGSGSWEFIDF